MVVWRVKADTEISAAASRPRPPVVRVAVVVGFPLLAYGLPQHTPRVLCPVLALVLVTEGDSRRWRDGDPLLRQPAVQPLSVLLLCLLSVA